jgi:hypothetical protein
MTKTMAGIRERKVTPKWRFMADFPCKTEGRDSLCKTVSQDLYYLAISSNMQLQKDIKTFKFMARIVHIYCQTSI